LSMEGTITGEHGIGLSLRDMLLEEIGTAGVDMTRKVRSVHRAECLHQLTDGMIDQTCARSALHSELRQGRAHRSMNVANAGGCRLGLVMEGRTETPDTREFGSTTALHVVNFVRRRRVTWIALRY